MDLPQEVLVDLAGNARLFFLLCRNHLVIFDALRGFIPAAEAPPIAIVTYYRNLFVPSQCAPSPNGGLVA